LTQAQMHNGPIPTAVLEELQAIITDLNAAQKA
jgi:hypothetical protein